MIEAMVVGREEEEEEEENDGVCYETDGRAKESLALDLGYFARIWSRGRSSTRTRTLPLEKEMRSSRAGS